MKSNQDAEQALADLKASVGEAQAEQLLRDYRKENINYNGWRLKDVPFAVLWNMFSRSNWRI